jgi:hypothetical protein
MYVYALYPSTFTPELTAIYILDLKALNSVFLIGVPTGVLASLSAL